MRIWQYQIENTFAVAGRGSKQFHYG